MIAYRSLSAAILCALALGCAGRAPAPAPADSAPTPTAKTTADALIPREVLFGNPDRAGVRLSPDGRFVSWLAPLNGVLNVYVAPAGALDQARPITQDAKRGIRKYEWAFDGAHLLYLQDTEGDENYRVHRVHVESGTTVDLTPFPGARADLAGLSSDVPGAALILINKRDPRLMDLYRVDLATGELTEVLRNEAGYTEFVVDLQLKPRLVQRFTPDGGTEYLKLVGDKAEPFMKVPQEDTLTTHAYGFDGSGKTLYMVDSRGRDTGALFAIDMASGQAKLLGEDAHADVDEVLTHPKTGEVQAWASSYTRREWHFVDPAMRTDFETLAGVARGELYVTSRTLDDRFWIVAFDTDDGPMRVYRYDRENRKAD
ncbi:MAG: S9 family peptidase, partial [Myxococcales bacterium]|nr:S9 family peptidase [Myxococcales bacterium]